MALRHKQRLVHRQIVNLLRLGLLEFGWVDEPVIFAATPVTLLDSQPDERGEPIAPNTVTVTMGDEQEDLGEELGYAYGGLESTEIPLFVDIYGERQGISIALGADIKLILKNRMLPLLDWDDTPTGAMFEVDEVFGPEAPDASVNVGAENFKRHWRVVKARIIIYFQD